MCVIYSAIHPNFKRKVLRRAALCAFPGFTFLFLLGVYGTPLFLETWGLLVFGIGIGAVAWGLIPYQRLKRLETSPHTITITEENWIITRVDNEQNVPANSIKGVRYIASKKVYGIELTLQDRELFLPFFSRSAYARLHDIMHTDEPNESFPL